MTVSSTTNTTATPYQPDTAYRQEAGMRGGASPAHQAMQTTSQSQSAEDALASSQAASATGQTTAVEPTPVVPRTEPAPAGAISRSSGHAVDTMA